VARKRRIRLRITRDLVTFSTGLAGIVHETFLASADRPYLLVLFGTMIGLPAFARMGDKKADEEVKQP